ncbi:heterokaryon incompatibility protein-domain-containing protein [Aspergillus coremiiformis]|uniref:Heterokaryon incompatibility protein-domain-containing protein n=1 Tax=Aspergillus coremiiformis TaxID=138285 RepID=A0A5N6ZCY3_9EURO|nr:heterokaryon incompatibility protein-domain-containing protein [Aspergillus coremiiformis]
MSAGRLPRFSTDIRLWAPKKCKFVSPTKYGDVVNYAAPSLRPFVNWEIAQTWVNSRPYWFPGQPAVRRLQKLKVIDVQKNQVVEAPEHCRFLALSYVFGAKNRIELQPPYRFQRDHLPKTIRDAVVACGKLDYRYLWIDQLCIDQSNETEVEEQINQMDGIYARAVCTLVALEGIDSDHGLPGVTVPRFWDHTVVHLGDVVFADTAPSLEDVLGHSKWLSRGWTLQESFYSSSQLFFTKYGVYYTTIGNPIGSPAIRSETPCDGKYDFTGYALSRRNSYWKILEQYSRRHLTYQSDALRAFTAVLRATYGDETYHGIPLNHIDRAITWTHDESLALSYSRDGFPSWSWTSHLGPVRHIGKDFEFGLATWAIPGDYPNSAITVCKPPYYKPIGSPYSRELGDPRSLVHRIIMVWLNGCVSSPFPVEECSSSPLPISTPSDLESDLFFEDVGLLPKNDLFSPHHLLIDALARRWGGDNAFFDDRYGQMDLQTVFPKSHRVLASAAPGRILVHTQTAYFYLLPFKNQHTDGSQQIFWILCQNRTIAGDIWLPRYHQTLRTDDLREFILLSIGRSPSSIRYNCFWYDEIGDPEDYVGGEINVEPREELERMQRGIALRVMLIERQPGTDIARRLGIGHILLETWLKADPQFQTLILE